MTAFYMPIGEAAAGLRRVWCRCDGCYQSGPLAEFALYVRQGRTMELCCNCAEHEGEWLQVEGWHRQ